MTRRYSLQGLGLAAVVGVALAFLGALLGGSIVSAQGATVDGGTWTFDEGSTGNTVEIMATGFPSAGLGAADITIAFDSAVLEITACGTGDLSGACNPNAPGGPAQAAGFDANGITTEPAIIATLTFDCVGAAGASSALTITVNDFVDGTPGAPGDISTTVQNGTVTCAVAATPTPSPTPSPTPVPSPVAPPPTGSAPPPAGSSVVWIIALGASIAVLGLGVGSIGAIRLRRRV